MSVNVIIMGIKDRRTKILMTLLLMSDTSFNSVSFDLDVRASFDISINSKTLITLSSLSKDGLIEYIESSSAPSSKLTAKGFYDIVLTYPVFRFTQEKWDDKWRILSYEIPEKKRELRDRFRRKVASWGMGPWHRSFWITPHPIIPYLKELVTDRAEEQYIQAFEADHVFGDREILIEKVWGKSFLEKKYRSLFKIWHTVLSTDKPNTDKMASIVSSYINVLKDDPGLPKKLIGEGWIGFEAINLFGEIRSILLKKT